jgi:hypothetical protein
MFQAREGVLEIENPPPLISRWGMEQWWLRIPPSHILSKKEDARHQKSTTSYFKRGRGAAVVKRGCWGSRIHHIPFRKGEGSSGGWESHCLAFQVRNVSRILPPCI